MTTELKYMSQLYKGYMLPPDKIPLIVSNTVLAGYFFGDDGLAVVSFLMPIFFLFEGVGYWINCGAFAKSLESVSKDETEFARSYSTLAIILSAVAGIILTGAVIWIFPRIPGFLEIPEKLIPFAEEYGTALAVSGFFLIVAQYFWQFVKLVGLQARVRKIYVLIMIVDVLAVVACVKIFSLGIISLAVGMIFAEIFIILAAGLWLSKAFRKNLFGEVQQPISSICGIISAGGAFASGKFYSLIVVMIFNWFLLNSYGVEGVAIFAVLQTAIRICRLHSQVTWQPLLPILTMEHADKNVAAMLLLFKHSLRQAVIMAILPAVVIYFGAEYFAAELALREFAVKAFQAYSLSVVFAAVNSIFIIAYSVENYKIFANALELLRTLIFVWLFVKLADPSLIFWAFLFAETTALIIIAAGGFVMCKIRKLKTPLLLGAEFFKPSLFMIVERSQGLTAENYAQLKNFVDDKIIRFLDEWLILVKQFSDTGKNDFTTIHIFNAENETRLTLRSTGKLFDYKSNEQGLKLVNGLEKIISRKFTFTLGLNNLYIRLER